VYCHQSRLILVFLINKLDICKKTIKVTRSKIVHNTLLPCIVHIAKMQNIKISNFLFHMLCEKKKKISHRY